LKKFSAWHSTESLNGAYLTVTPENTLYFVPKNSYLMVNPQEGRLPCRLRSRRQERFLEFS